MDIYDQCNNEEYLEIFNSHPQLAIEKIVTKNSLNEQNQAKLYSCTKKELEEFTKLNQEYKKRFKFPFIITVSGLNKIEILDNFRRRINRNFIEEFEEAKIQVKKIGIIRLNQILDKKNEDI